MHYIQENPMKEKTLLHKILPYLLVLPSMLLLVVVVLFPIISNIGRDVYKRQE